MKKIITIIWDKDCSGWADNQEYSFMFLRYIENHINDFVRAKGYIYLNQIYELLGVEWNPKSENVCVERTNEQQLMYVEFETFKIPDGSFLIHIHTYGGLES